MRSLHELIRHLTDSSGVLKEPRVIEAFESVDRADFVPEAYRENAYDDAPLPIGHGQTISQPTTVAFMLELLGPLPGQKVLDVGCGSGWTTALLAHIVGTEGKIIGVERIPELVALGRENLAKYDLPQADIRRAGEVLGVPSEVPFDRILVSAAANDVPQELLDQLTTLGIAVLPVRHDILRIRRRDDGTFEEETYEGFVFVPLIA
ncbi:MAG TPA: protein-L-isoaspartate(D-aspartate) O-methyltransferase [Candidatus Paceibacterota bacterium]|nr:protein-L-isoaspartate(D-aspartate) O-methyltransferase [Candidatus Paceibacterota bacterium]